MSDKRILKFGSNRVWRTYNGGKLLDQIEGKEIPADSHFPEDWIASVVQARNPGREEIVEGLSKTDDDTGGEVVLRDLLQSNLEFYLGDLSEKENALDDLPLVKYLDSATRLHFQAHPTSEFARERLGSPRGKTEAYVILDIRDDVENPYIYAGFQRPPSREQLKQWILDQNIEEIEKCFDKIPVKPGDVFLITGGRPHALGEGILMLEIMEASDLAVRFEFEREGFVIPEEARFMGRDMETAMDVFNLSAVPPSEVDSVFRCAPRLIEKYNENSVYEELIGYDQTPCFAVRRSVVQGKAIKKVSSSFIAVVVDGEGSVSIDGVTTELKKWDRFFCPAGNEEIEIYSENGITILESYPRDLEK